MAATADGRPTSPGRTSSSRGAGGSATTAAIRQRGGCIVDVAPSEHRGRRRHTASGGWCSRRSRTPDGSGRGSGTPRTPSRPPLRRLRPGPARQLQGLVGPVRRDVHAHVLAHSQGRGVLHQGRHGRVSSFRPGHRVRRHGWARRRYGGRHSVPLRSGRGRHGSLSLREHRQHDRRGHRARQEPGIRRRAARAGGRIAVRVRDERSIHADGEGTAVLRIPSSHRQGR
mmetsp:Transcript_29533/g.71335  ORF Transcript_29533/g.71335 Transcript_29533/m.71335 type:complete len:227 (-) Transcript_29533:808-1488(-)